MSANDNRNPAKWRKIGNTIATIAFGFVVGGWMSTTYLEATFKETTLAVAKVAVTATLGVGNAKLIDSLVFSLDSNGGRLEIVPDDKAPLAVKGPSGPIPLVAKTWLPPKEDGTGGNGGEVVVNASQASDGTVSFSTGQLDPEVCMKTLISVPYSLDHRVKMAVAKGGSRPTDGWASPWSWSAAKAAEACSIGGRIHATILPRGN